MNVKKFKNIYLAILIPITVIICIASIWYRSMLVVKEVSNALRDGNWGNAITSISDDFKDMFQNGNVNINGVTVLGDNVKKEYTDIEFTDVDIDLAFANVEFKEGNEYKVVVEYPAEYLPEVKVDGDTLEIKHNTKSYSVQLNGINHIACDVTVYIPKGTELEKVKIATDLGNIELKGEYTFESLNIEANLGNIEINSMVTDDLVINADLGSVELRDCNIGTLDITADLGDVTLKNCKFESGEIQDDLGSIEVDAEFGYLEANCSLGALEVKCDNISDAKMDLKTDLGAVTVNGRSHGSSYKQ